MSSRDLAVLEILREEARARGLLPTARRLRLHRSTLASALAGAARPGTVLLVVARAREAGYGAGGRRAEELAP